MAIKVKAKPCKGNYRTEYYEGCGEETPYRTYGLCNSKCYINWLKSGTEGANEKIRKLSIEASKKIRSEKKKEQKEQKEKNKTVTQVINEVRPVFQKYIRIRDANLECISCKTVSSSIWDGGHFYKAELYSGLVFDERNVHKQCRKCNGYLGGNENNYRLGLINRYGVEFVEALDKDALLMRSKKYTKIELYELKEVYKNKIKHLLDEG